MLLNYNQLAFILDITPLEALKKIIYSYCKENEKVIPPNRNYINDYKSLYPSELDLSIIEKHTGLPLSLAVRDIQENYLKHPSSKKWILCDYPEKELTHNTKDKIKIPKALESLLHPDTVETIKKEWKSRYDIG